MPLSSVKKPLAISYLDAWNKAEATWAKKNIINRAQEILPLASLTLRMTWQTCVSKETPSLDNKFSFIKIFSCFKNKVEEKKEGKIQKAALFALEFFYLITVGLVCPSWVIAKHQARKFTFVDPNEGVFKRIENFVKQHPIAFSLATSVAIAAIGLALYNLTRAAPGFTSTSGIIPSINDTVLTEGYGHKAFKKAFCTPADHLDETFTNAFADVIPQSNFFQKFAKVNYLAQFPQYSNVSKPLVASMLVLIATVSTSAFEAIQRNKKARARALGALVPFLPQHQQHNPFSVFKTPSIYWNPNLPFGLNRLPGFCKSSFGLPLNIPNVKPIHDPNENLHQFKKTVKKKQAPLLTIKSEAEPYQSVLDRAKAALNSETPWEYFGLKNGFTHDVYKVELRQAQLKYHPDKCKDPLANDIIQVIHALDAKCRADLLVRKELSPFDKCQLLIDELISPDDIEKRNQRDLLINELQDIRNSAPLDQERLDNFIFILQASKRYLKLEDLKNATIFSRQVCEELVLYNDGLLPKKDYLDTKLESVNHYIKGEIDQDLLETIFNKNEVDRITQVYDEIEEMYLAAYKQDTEENLKECNRLALLLIPVAPRGILDVKNKFAEFSSPINFYNGTCDQLLFKCSLIIAFLEVTMKNNQDDDIYNQIVDIKHDISVDQPEVDVLEFFKTQYNRLSEIEADIQKSLRDFRLTRADLQSEKAKGAIRHQAHRKKVSRPRKAQASSSQLKSDLAKTITEKEQLEAEVVKLEDEAKLQALKQQAEEKLKAKSANDEKTNMLKQRAAVLATRKLGGGIGSPKAEALVNLPATLVNLPAKSSAPVLAVVGKKKSISRHATPKKNPKRTSKVHELMQHI